MVTDCGVYCYCTIFYDTLYIDSSAKIFLNLQGITTNVVLLYAESEGAAQQHGLHCHKSMATHVITITYIPLLCCC